MLDKTERLALNTAGLALLFLLLLYLYSFARGFANGWQTVSSTSSVFEPETSRVLLESAEAVGLQESGQLPAADAILGSQVPVEPIPEL